MGSKSFWAYCLEGSSDNIHPKDQNEDRTTIKFSTVYEKLYPNIVSSHLLSGHEKSVSTQNKIKLFMIKFVNKIWEQ